MKSRYKILILVGLPLYGFLLSQFGTDYITIIANLGAAILSSLLILPLFYNEEMYQYEWITYPIMHVFSNLIFWIPVGMILIKYFEKREKRTGKNNDN